MCLGTGAVVYDGSWKQPGKPGQEGSGGVRDPQKCPGVVGAGAVGFPDTGSWETCGSS